MLILVYKNQKTRLAMVYLFFIPNRIKLLPGLVLLLFVNLTNPVNAEEPKLSALKIAHLQTSSLLHVQASQIPFRQLMTRLAAAVHFDLHYSQIPTETVVNGDCLGINLGQVLQCLLGVSINSVVRYSEQGSPTEVWLLEEKSAGRSLSSGSANTQDILFEEEIDPVLDEAQSSDPLLRVQAITQLGASTVRDKVLAKSILSSALEDQSPAIRARAIASLTKLDSAAALPELQKMLNDTNIKVRLAAVVAAHNLPDILEIAKSDSNAQISSLAEISLTKLNKAAENNQ